MLETDARDLIRWMIRWNGNTIPGYEFSDPQIATAARHFFAGIDPWESVSAIQEGRTLLKRKSK